VLDQFVYVQVVGRARHGLDTAAKASRRGGGRRSTRGLPIARGAVQIGTPGGSDAARGRGQRSNWRPRWISSLLLGDLSRAGWTKRFRSPIEITHLRQGRAGFADHQIDSRHALRELTSWRSAQQPAALRSCHAVGRPHQHPPSRHQHAFPRTGRPRPFAQPYRCGALAIQS